MAEPTETQKSASSANVQVSHSPAAWHPTDSQQMMAVICEMVLLVVNAFLHFLKLKTENLKNSKMKREVRQMILIILLFFHRNPSRQTRILSCF